MLALPHSPETNHEVKPMAKPNLPGVKAIQKSTNKSNHRRRARRNSENSDVLVSAVISSYLLSHLHHVLQKAEFIASQEGRNSQAHNLAQLRKVLCMDARSMEDASAKGIKAENPRLKSHIKTNRAEMHKVA